MENRLTKFLKAFSVIGISFIIVIFMITQFTNRDSFAPLNYQVETLDGEAQLILEDGSVRQVSARDERYVYEEAIPGELITIALKLPKIEGNDKCISVFACEQDIGIYINGELKTYYSDEEYRMAGTYSASRFVIVPLEPGDSEKELRITYQTTVADYAGTLSCPRFGTGQDILFWIYFRYTGQITTAILLLAVGIVFILFGLVLSLKHKDNKGICYLGVFSVIMALWIFCQSNMRVFYSSYLSAVNLMSLYAIMIAPIPILIFFNTLMKYQYQNSYNTMVIVSIANVVIAMILEFAGIEDTINILQATHVIIAMEAALCLGTMYQYMKDGDIVEPRLVMIGLIGFFAVIVIEEVNLLFLNDFFVGKYLGYGILFFLFNLGYASLRSTEEQEREYREAVRASHLKSSFLANMSHEIRTPISTILGMNEMILAQSDDEDITHYAQNINNAGNILLAQVNDILDFTKIEAGKMEIIPIRYELCDILKDLLHLAQTRAELKGLSLIPDIEENIPNYLYGDETRLRQAVSNLLSNAVKYTQKGSVTLKVRHMILPSDQVGLIISVADTGIGIRKEDKERLFDSFVRLEESRNRSIEGTGLGLSITNYVIREMGGSIEVRSEYGKGSVFTISVAQKMLDRRPIGRLEDWYRNTQLRPKNYMDQYEIKDVRILLVDDNEMNLEVIRGLLKKTQVVIDTADSGRECLRLLEQRKYDLILLDHMMPEMDGIQTLKKIQELKPAGGRNTPVIVLTANAVSGAREEYLKQGFDDYVAKPVEYMKLIEIMKKFLPDKVRKRSAIDLTQEESDNYLEQQGIHMSDALKYTAGDISQYRHLLELFIKDREHGKQVLLEDAYKLKDWKNYVTCVHGLKNCARMIGADELADMAYEHECKGKEQDEAYVTEHYPVLICKWNETMDVIVWYLEKQSQREQGSRDEAATKQELEENEWRDRIQQIAQYLNAFKKKEALEMLKELEGFGLESAKRQKLEETIEAVKCYDYERAIDLLLNYDCES